MNLSRSTLDPSLLIAFNRPLLRYVNSVKELTQILVANVGSLLNLCSSERDECNVVSREFNLILGFGRPDEFNSWHEHDLSDTLFSQKITNLDRLSRKRDINREMGIDESHLVEKTASDTRNHVVNVRTDGSDAGKLLTCSEPKVDLDLLGLLALFVFDLNDSAVHGNVLEIPLKSTARSSDLDFTSIAINVNCNNENERREWC